MVRRSTVVQFDINTQKRIHRSFYNAEPQKASFKALLLNYSQEAINYLADSAFNWIRQSRREYHSYC
ncbi:unnamed protein product [Acanthoscelides obtectus]|uniref:Uncharacterized protein n=1 Tax=Acanthoscelides obtectus TaxID=200917 RepID=A0A9P0JGB7_ACAOB|nr:unnamed protein product [Acanthoscelides obtectus]CAK1661386.1 hypothetical protein AOBTE_LOCUS22595 [Acanthoscelides obtectus]